MLRWCRTRNQGTDFGAPERLTPTDRWRPTAGDVARETFGSARSPAVGGRQDRVRSDVRAGLLGELEASVDPRPVARHRPPSRPEPTPFSSDRVPHQRHKRLLANSRRGPFGRKLGKTRRAGKADLGYPDAREEFADSIRNGTD